MGCCTGQPQKRPKIEASPDVNYSETLAKRTCETESNLGRIPIYNLTKHKTKSIDAQEPEGEEHLRFETLETNRRIDEEDC